MLELFRRLRYFLKRDAMARELEEEMRHHLALKAEAEGSAGAHLQFGNTTLYQEQSRAMWNFTVFEQLGQDIRYAFRTMAASPLFTAAAVLSLALGIGANTAIYSFMDAILLRSLPVRDPESLVILQWRASERTPVIHSVTGTMRRDGEHGRTSPNLPYAAWGALRSNLGPLADLVAYSTYDQLNLVIKGQAETAHASFVSGNFYEGLGVVPAYGRLIGPDDDRVGAPPVAVISYDYFERRFEGDPAAVGKTILVNNQPVMLAGVSAPGFFGVDPGHRPVILLPLRSKAQYSDRVEANERRLFFDPHVYWVEMMARLRPGVSLEQAQTSLRHQFREFVLSTATSDKERSVLPQLWLEPGASGLDSLRQDYSKPLYVLITMVALILTIACANIANLLLARSAARRREIAVRLSLGAGRARIVRQLLTESVGLSLVGGALGVLVAFWGIRFITWVIANGQENFSLHAELNWPVLGFTLTLALAAGMLFGLAPALQATKVNLSPALKEAAGAAVPGKRWQFLSLSRVLVCAQIAMSLLLVFGASLFVRTMANLHSVDVGFNRDNVLLFSVNARQAGYQNEALARFYADLATRIRALPGVRAAGMSNFPLAARYVNSEGVSIPGMPALDPRHSEVDTLSVDDGFMDAMQIPVLLGRGLSQRDIGTHGMAVVNQKFAEAFFAGANPLGRVFVLGGPRDPHQYEIVGVSRSTHYNSLKEELQPVAYLPYTQNLNDLRQMFFEVRTAGDPLTALNPIRAIVHEASAAVSINDVSTQSRIIEQTISQEHTFADLCTCFAALALAIACVGLYGSISYAVARRTRELGIRMALGAERGAIVWMVLRQALILAAVGLAIGLFVAQQMAHLVASFLWNMKPGDPAAIAISIAILFTASVAASFVPAWRASRTDPMLAIRHE